MQRYARLAIKTAEDAAIKLHAPIKKVAALHAAVRTDTKEMDSPVKVSYVISNHYISTASNG